MSDDMIVSLHRIPVFIELRLNVASLVLLVLLFVALDGRHAQLDEHGAELVPVEIRGGKKRICNIYTAHASDENKCRVWYSVVCIISVTRKGHKRP